MAPLCRAGLGRLLLSGSDTAETRLALSWVEREFGIGQTQENRLVLRAIAAVKVGVLPGAAAKTLGWKEFETFCASLIRAKGFEVTEDITMTKPRSQVDLLARTPSIALAVDCKHWARTMGMTALSRVAEAQARRADQIRMKFNQIEPIIVVILVIFDEPTRYVNGAAVVPIYALEDFLENVDSYSEGFPRH